MKPADKKQGASDVQEIITAGDDRLKRRADIAARLRKLAANASVRAGHVTNHFRVMADALYWDAAELDTAYHTFTENGGSITRDKPDESHRAILDGLQLALTRLRNIPGPGDASLPTEFVDQLNSAADEIDPTPGVSTSAVKPADEGSAYPGEHYSDERGIPASRLEAARRAGKLPGSTKPHGRWLYVESEVKALWPHDFIEPAETR